MARRFESDYRMKDGETHLSEAFFNPVFRDMDLRLHAQEIVEKDWLAAVDSLNRYGLKRIDDYLSPAIKKVERVVELGFMQCQSATPLRFEAGLKGVVVTAGDQRDLFTPSPFISITRQDSVDDYAVARLVSWDVQTGALQFQILRVNGSVGPHSDVVISSLPGGVEAIRGYLDQCQAILVQLETANASVEQINAIISGFSTNPDSVAALMSRVIAVESALASAESHVAAQLDAQQVTINSLIADANTSMNNTVNQATATLTNTLNQAIADMNSSITAQFTGLRGKIFFRGAL